MQQIFFGIGFEQHLNGKKQQYRIRFRLLYRITAAPCSEQLFCVPGDTSLENQNVEQQNATID
jgi:hypothetical protein